MQVRRITLFILISTLTSAFLLAAREGADTVKSIPGIEIKSSVDIAEAYIGDPITYQITITHDPSIELLPPPIGANLGAFDVKDYHADVETKLKDGRVQNQTTFILSTFTTGNYIIPPLPVQFVMPDSTRKVMLAEGVPIKIKSLLESASDSADVHPLKGPYQFKRNLTPYYIWGGIILALIAVGAYIWWRLRNKKPASEPVDLRPPWEIAFEKLAMLKEKRLLQEGKHKEFYIELTEIVRSYLGRVYTITVLDMTTSEFLDEFEEMELPEGLFEQTSKFLHHADLVKFAKYIPEPERSGIEYQTAHDLVESVRSDYVHRQEIQVHLVTGAPTAPVESRGKS